jgi:hypothetical protein
MGRMTEPEAKYLLQLYSTNGEVMTYADFLKTITPRSINAVPFPSAEHLKQSVAEACLQEFWSLLHIEL